MTAPPPTASDTSVPRDSALKQHVGTTRAVVVAVALLLAGCSSGQVAEDRKGQTNIVTGGGTVSIFAPGERKAAPEVKGETLDGKQWSLADQRGKVVVLNVWGSWCAPCRKEAPELVAAAKQLGAGTAFVGLNTRDLDKAPAQKFVKEFGVTFPSVYDPSGKQLLGFKGQVSPRAIPTTVVIDAEGNVAATVVGAVTTKTLVDVVNDVGR